MHLDLSAVGSRRYLLFVFCVGGLLSEPVCVCTWSPLAEVSQARSIHHSPIAHTAEEGKEHTRWLKFRTFSPSREHLLSVRSRVGVLPRRLDLPPVLTGEKGCLRKWACWWYGSRGTATSILEQEENDGKASFSNDGCFSEKLLSFEFLLRGFFAAASIQKCCHLGVAIADNLRLRGVQPVNNISELR